MSKSIKVSPKHGANPSMLHCAICGEVIGIALMGRLPGDEEAPRDISDGSSICDTCEHVIKVGVMLIETTDGEQDSNPKHPNRTGRTVGIREAGWHMINTGPMPEDRVAYMEHNIFELTFGEEFKKQKELQKEKENSGLIDD